MAGNNINSETKIEMTISRFFALIGTIIGGLITIFSSFYFVVFLPKVETEIESLREINQMNIELFNAEIKPYLEQIEKMNGRVGNIETQVNGISGRFNDLNSLRNELNNSGGLTSANTPPPSN